jgi:hypothetical protein
MNFMRGFQYIQDRKDWLKNLLVGAVCMLIPALGQIIYTGYLFEVIDALHADPEHKGYPDFDFNRFSEYLARGVWPWLVEVLLALVTVIPMVAIFIGLMILMVAVFQHPLAVLGAVGIFVLILVPLALILNPLTWGALLQTGITGEFQPGAIWNFNRDFVRRLRNECFKAGLVFALCNLVLVIASIITFGLAAYVLSPVLAMAQHHWMFQMYELYLQRGGSPIGPGVRPRAPSDEPPIAEAV